MSEQYIDSIMHGAMIKGIVGVTALVSENMTTGITCFSWKLHLFEMFTFLLELGKLHKFY